jgi:two-component system response regulator HydG
MSIVEQRKSSVLIVDDDQATVDALARALRSRGYLAEGTTRPADVLDMVKNQSFRLVISDLVMPEMNGIALLENLHKLDPSIGVIVCTGFGTIASAVEAMRKGATDYLTKPVNLEHLYVVVERAMRLANLADENLLLREELARFVKYEGITGDSPAIQKVYAQIEAVSPTDATVLIRGESGTGKELVARAIHKKSARANRPLVAVNCAAFADTLVETELFGHERGAFTGAWKQTKGRIEQAEGGTLFLDEVGDLSPAAQSKLLRLLQERTFERVGSSHPIKADVRIIAATHRPLEKLIEEERFRGDLFYRINVFPIDVPALRDRWEDIGQLFSEFLSEFGERYNKPGIKASPEVVGILERHDWPGNIRELRNIAENLVILAQTPTVETHHLPRQFDSAASLPSEEDTWLSGAYSLEEVEREVIRRTLFRTRGNKAQTAKMLGIGLKTLYRRLERDLDSPNRSDSDEE